MELVLVEQSVVSATGKAEAAGSISRPAWVTESSKSVWATYQNAILKEMVWKKKKKRKGACEKQRYGSVVKVKRSQAQTLVYIFKKKKKSQVVGRGSPHL